MALKLAVVVFPGTNCDRETLSYLRSFDEVSAEPVWHHQSDLSSFDGVVLPGGFAHGDHLRAGAIARFSPIMTSVTRFARTDRLVWGICNGFQVLLEAGLLPGAMLPNACRSFVCTWVNCRVEHSDGVWTRRMAPGEILKLPIAHGMGRYYAPPDLGRRLDRGGQVLLRYCDRGGAPSADSNPNGSFGNIAGLSSEGGNVFGMMPHPERAADRELGSSDGRPFVESLLIPSRQDSLAGVGGR